MGFSCATAAQLRSEVSESTTPPVLPTTWVGTPRRRSRAGLSIYSILLIMLLSVSVLSSIVVGIIGYLNGTEALRTIAYERLVEIRENRSREVAAAVRDDRELRAPRRDERDEQAGRPRIHRGIRRARDSSRSPTPRRRPSNAYYRDTFAADLSEATGEEVDGSTFAPAAAPRSTCSTTTSSRTTSWEDAIKTDDAGDGSAWSQAHAKYHDYFRWMTELQDFEDVLMLDTEGNVVYSAYKGVDLGTNLFDGPYRLSNLSQAYQQAMDENILGKVVFADFAPYSPSLGTPAGWAVTPIADDGEMIGALAIELPIDRINEVMTVGGEWAANGLGKTGETYLVGERRADAIDLAPARGGPRGLQEGCRRRRPRRPPPPPSACRTATRCCSSRSAGDAVTRCAAPARTGTLLERDYLGRDSLTAYAPLNVDGLNWVIVAQETSAEALVPGRGLHPQPHPLHRRHDHLRLPALARPRADLRAAAAAPQDRRAADRRG